MKKKFSIVLTTLAVVGLATTALAANFTVDVKIGSADAGTSLTFGTAAADNLQPFPPFSAMFGVKDVFLANSSNYTESPDVSGDMSRLSVDIRKNADKWVIVANSNASLIFEMSGAEQVYVAYIDPKTSELKTDTVENNGTLSVKGGVQYTITRTENTEVATVSEDPNNLNVAATKDAGGTYTATKELEVVAGHGYTVYFATPNAVNSDSADWDVEITNAENLVFAADGYSATFTATASTVAITVQATSGSSSAITVSLVDNDEARKIAAINAILQKFGTLDFDQDGEVGLEDIMYLYNFAVVWFQDTDDPNDLAPGSGVSDPVRLANALDTLRGDSEMADYDESGEVGLEDVMFLYNYAVVWFKDTDDSGDLAPGSGVTDVEKLDKALENLKDQSE